MTQVTAYPQYEQDEETGVENYNKIIGYHVFSTINLGNHTVVRAVIDSPTEQGASAKECLWHVRTEYSFKDRYNCFHNWMGYRPENYLTQADAIKVGKVIAQRVGQLPLHDAEYADQAMGMFIKLESELKAEGILKTIGWHDNA